MHWKTVALGLVSLVSLPGCPGVEFIYPADSGPVDAATAPPGDASVGDAGRGADASGGVDAGRDAGFIVVVPPPLSPIKTVRRPERSRRDRRRARAAMHTISLMAPSLAIPGADEVAIHDLMTGDIVARYPTQAQPYATEWLEAGGFERLVTVGSAGANINTCTDAGVSMFGQLLYPFSPPNITDLSPLASSPAAAVLCDNTNGRLERIGFDEVGGLFDIEQSVDLLASASGGRLVSAEAPRGDSPLLVAIDGTPGELRWVDWSSTPATVTEVGLLESSPRILGCAPSGDVCFVPNYGSASVSVIDTRAALPVMRASVSVGAGPISVDVQELEGRAVGVTTGFMDDSLHYLVDEGSAVRVVSESLSDCGSPGHALLIPELRWVVVTCNADESYVVRAIPSSVP